MEPVSSFDTYTPVTPAQLMRLGLANVSCALGYCSKSGPEGHSQLRELWFSLELQNLFFKLCVLSLSTL